MSNLKGSKFLCNPVSEIQDLGFIPKNLQDVHFWGGEAMLGQGRSDKNAATRSSSTKPSLLSQLGDSENVFVDPSFTPRAMHVV